MEVDLIDQHDRGCTHSERLLKRIDWLQTCREHMKLICFTQQIKKMRLKIDTAVLKLRIRN